MANTEQPKFSHNDAMQLIGKMRIIYGKKFSDQWSGIKPSELASEMVDLFSDLTIAQVAKGCEKMKTQSWCPSLPEFRSWCIDGGLSSVHASYRAKNAALANIEAWIVDDSIEITNAEREAYNRCYTMFNDLKWNYSDKQKFHTYAAFKDFYDEVVRELIEKNIPQSIWVKPKQIEKMVRPVVEDNPSSKETIAIAKAHLANLRELLKANKNTIIGG